MITSPDFGACFNNDDCGLLIANFIEEHKDEDTFFYPLLQMAGAFQFDTDGWGEICFVEMERQRLEELYWNNNEYVSNRDFSKHETDEEFRAREAEETRLMAEIRSKVKSIIDDKLAK